MAIGTTAAIVGSAVLGAGASILGSKAQKKAAGKAADASEAAAAAQLQLGREGLAFNRDIYNANFGLLSPFVSRGNVAGNQINALLGLPNAPAIASPLAAPAGGSFNTSANDAAKDAWASQVLEHIMPHIGPKRTATAMGISDPSQRLDYLNTVFHTDERGIYNSYIQANPYNPPAVTQPAPATPAAPQAPAARPTYDRGTETLAEHQADMRAWRAGQQGAAPGATPSAANSAQSAFEQFANSAGMQFQQKEAANAINQNYAGAGALQSGAAMKAISDRAQQVALNNYFLPYMSLLGGQQGAGLQAGAAVAGVGTNASNTNANINAGMGNAIGQNAANIGNLALANGQNQANMWANLGSSFGNALGGLSK